MLYMTQSTTETVMTSDNDDEYMFDADNIIDDGSDFDFAGESVSDHDYGYGMSFSGGTNNERKAYEVEFTVQSVDDLVASQNKEVDQVTAVLDVSSTTAAALLRYFRWNKERLFERFMDSPKSVLELAGIAVGNQNKNIQVLLPSCQLGVDSFTCEICYDDDVDVMTAGACCGHRYCVNCYQYYVKQKINEGAIQDIRCPYEKCMVVVDESMIQQLVNYSDEDGQATTTSEVTTIMTKYQQLLNNAFVDNNDHLRWCPAPDCDYAVECHVPATSLTSIVPTVQCACDDIFCFGCGEADHQPAVCPMVKSWIKKCEEDSKTAQWMANHTKECPKCSAFIEKNGGCNYMRCRKCSYSFCWVCLHSLENTHHCNRYHDGSTAVAEDNKKKVVILKRYMHYYERYNNHEKSAKLDQGLYEKTEENMSEMQQRSDLSWIEVQFLKTAVDVAVKCRTTLKWTYAFAFYLAKTNETDIFEDNQQDLELATEQLSELLEQPFDENQWPMWRRAVLDKTAYVKGRREVLLDDTAKGLADGRWTFDNGLD